VVLEAGWDKREVAAGHRFGEITTRVFDAATFMTDELRP
jgi:hypothetical protein